jgi:plasmid stabilization system protein ParE
MPQVIITERARQNIEKYYQFLVGLDAAVALRAVQSIYEGFLLLKDVPEIGRPVEDELYLRERVIVFGDSGYVVLYRYKNGDAKLLILTLRHQKECGYDNDELLRELKNVEKGVGVRSHQSIEYLFYERNKISA